MIISFSGAQGTGKSQTIQAVIQKISEQDSFALCKYKPSCSTASIRQLYQAEGIAEDVPWWELTPQMQRRIQMLTMLNATADLLDAVAQQGDWLFDRSVVDVLAYTILKHRQGVVDRGLLRLLEISYARLIDHIDLVVLFTPDPAYAIEDKALRHNTDQAEVAEIFDSICRGIDVFVVPFGTIELKADAIVHKLRGMGMF